MAQQSGAEAAETMVDLVRRLGPAFCHYGSPGEPSLLSCCVSSQLKASADAPREVGNVVDFVRRLAAVGPASSSAPTGWPQHAETVQIVSLSLCLCLCLSLSLSLSLSLTDGHTGTLWGARAHFRVASAYN